ncbi:MAG: hypothetical protein F4139_01080 [Gemmatimonadetes bacterium]|nr:hypothetical protein [Gemmatimonadota bacterium]MYB99182.1 hypothetical protein [Gemmatimonadota bacterium]MYH51522.1 hypothetical protein [Gemmatimonadota bacterium]MYI46136.1 hypothetical protein [Gemmatimonadota bacterium]MYK67798.1 hypothetical protein [Gemmatimonadota bacterium]
MTGTRQNPSAAGDFANGRSILLLSWLFALACGGSDPDTPRVSGTWLGQDIDDGAWEFQLSGSQSVSGTYVLTYAGDATALSDDVSGNYDHPAVSLDFQVRWFADLIQSCDFRGTMAESGETIGGTVTCSGDGDDWSSALDLRREQ